MLTSAAIKELKKALGGENVSFSKEDAICYSYDALPISYLPDCVVFPGSAIDVSSVLKAANRFGFPVVPRGAGTGFSGGSLPTEGGVVLSTERMGRIVEIDKKNLTAEVEPGVITADLQDEAEAQGLFYPPDPTSVKFSTIGGNIAECAGGPRAVKYGVTRDYVLGLEVVLPTGEIINTGTRTIKGVVGYDLTRLIIGSEGTLGVVTRATLRLLPMPESTRTLLALFPEIKDAARAVSSIIKARIIPSTLELMDSTSVKCASEHAEVGLPKEGSVLLIEVDGNAASVEKEAGEIENICRDSGASVVHRATDKKEVKNLWKARRAVSAALFRARPNKINEDVVVPRSEVPALIGGIEEIGRELNLLIACFGHAGDGNIHVNVMYDRKDEREARAAEEAVRRVFELTLKLNGTIS